MYLQSVLLYTNIKRRILKLIPPDALLLSLGQLVDGLTGLERILTTPIPFSYANSLSSSL